MSFLRWFKKSQILTSSLKMASATLSSRVLGLIREQVLAATFGASGLTDAFTLAYRVPNMLRDLFAEGAFSSAFVPVFSEVRQKEGDEGARKLFWSVFFLLGSVTLVIALIIIWQSENIVQLMASNLFTEDKERFHISVKLVQIMAPFLCLISLSALVMGALNSLKVFFVPALAPSFFNLAMIFSMIVLPPFFEKSWEHGIYALGAGVLLGGLLQLIVQFPTLFRKKYCFLGPLELINDSTKKIANRLGIGTIGIAATQINILVTTFLATGTEIGAVSWLAYAFRLFQFPVGILGVSIAGTNLVHFSDAWKSNKKEEAIHFLYSSYILSFFLMIPAMALLVALCKESVHLVFERGAFSSLSTSKTSLALYAYLLGLPFYGIYKIFAPVFFAIDRPQLPIFISIFSIFFNIIFCLLLVPRYGFVVLAFGTSFSMLLNCFLQMFFLCRELKISWKKFFPLRLFKIFFAGSVCCYALNIVSPLYFDYSETFFYKALVFVGLCILGLLIYLTILAILGDFSMLRKFFKKDHENM